VAFPASSDPKVLAFGSVLNKQGRMTWAAQMKRVLVFCRIGGARTVGRDAIDYYLMVQERLLALRSASQKRIFLESVN
jgi:hypothetical protein